MGTFQLVLQCTALHCTLPCFSRVHLMQCHRPGNSVAKSSMLSLPAPSAAYASNSSSSALYRGTSALPIKTSSRLGHYTLPLRDTREIIKDCDEVRRPGSGILGHRHRHCYCMVQACWLIDLRIKYAHNLWPSSASGLSAT